MNILFYGSSYPPTPYGASRYVDNLTRALVEHGHQAVVVTHGDETLPKESRSDGVEIFRIGSYEALRSREMTRKALAIATDRKCDLIQGLDYLGESANLIREDHRPPVCIRVASSISLRMLRRSLGNNCWQRCMVELAAMRAWRQWRDERVSLQHADFLFAPSQRVLDELILQGMRLPQYRNVIASPVETPECWKNVEQPHSPILLYVGRLDFGKGVASLPAILRSVRQIHPNTILVLAGGDHYVRGLGSVSGWLRKRFGQDIDHVQFLGRVAESKLNSIYSQAWVVLVPSRWDNCPNVVLEAMARAKPLVVSPHGGMPELVEGCGVTVADPDDPGFVGGVLALLADSGLRRQQGERLRARARGSYSQKQVVEAYIRFVENGLAKID